MRKWIQVVNPEPDIYAWQKTDGTENISIQLWADGFALFRERNYPEENDVLKEFETLKQALKYAKEYMKENSD